MGIVFGITGTKEPSFQLLQSGIYEIRINQPYFVAEVKTEKYNGDDEPFRILAKYIGVFGKAENERADSIAMTAPVITETSEAISMTSPVITNQNEFMQFVLPFEYKNIESIPKPLDPRVTLHCIPERCLGVIKFSGWYSKKIGKQKFTQLYELLKSDNFLDSDYIKHPEHVRWNVAQYHPPFTIPFFRRNEIWIELNKETTPKLKELITKLNKH